MEIKKKIIKWLKSKKCIVFEIDDAAVVFFLEGFYGFIEVKKTKTSPRRPGQEAFVRKMDEWSWAKIVWGGKNTNWPEVQDELKEILR